MKPVSVFDKSDIGFNIHTGIAHISRIFLLLLFLVCVSR